MARVPGQPEIGDGTDPVRVDFAVLGWFAGESVWLPAVSAPASWRWPTGVEGAGQPDVVAASVSLLAPDLLRDLARGGNGPGTAPLPSARVIGETDARSRGIRVQRRRALHSGGSECVS
jgi:hypothetical protein